ncbi:YybS family protein [Acetobacterium sp.]|uniref:YybS family protein n=1 Tax=Acetobacterium sp. TaxID=1872094 RepID=UPI002F3E5297
MKTRGITEGAMFCALAVILALASFYVPFLVILIFFIPVPMVVLGQRQGLKVSVIASIAATIIIGLFLGPVNAIPFGVLLFFVGCSLGYAYHRNVGPIQKIIVGYLGFALVVTAVIISYQFLVGVDFITFILQTFEVSTQQALALYQNAGVMDASQLLLAKESLDAQINTMKMIIPSVILLLPLVFSFINVASSDAILKRLGYKVKAVKPLSQWEMPKSLKYFLLLFLFGSFIISVFQVTAIPEIYVLNIMNLVYLVYFVMGLSLIFDFMAYKKHTNMALKILAVFVALLLQFVVTMLGVADTYMEIRKIFRKGSEA